MLIRSKSSPCTKAAMTSVEELQRWRESFESQINICSVAAARRTGERLACWLCLLSIPFALRSPLYRCSCSRGDLLGRGSFGVHSGLLL